jgi:hypothetical protein
MLAPGPAVAPHPHGVPLGRSRARQGLRPRRLNPLTRDIEVSGGFPHQALSGGLPHRKCRVFSGGFPHRNVTFSPTVFLFLATGSGDRFAGGAHDLLGPFERGGAVLPFIGLAGAAGRPVGEPVLGGPTVLAVARSALFRDLDEAERHKLAQRRGDGVPVDAVVLKRGIRHRQFALAVAAVVGDLDLQAVDQLIQFPVINSGAFAARRDHPIWRQWQEQFRQATQRAVLKLSEQAALNLAIYSGPETNRPHLLPSLANWICLQSNPIWDVGRKKLVEPNLPHEVLGLVHLTGADRQTQMQIRTTTGGQVTGSLTYSGIRALAAGLCGVCGLSGSQM